MREKINLFIASAVFLLFLGGIAAALEWQGHHTQYTRATESISRPEEPEFQPLEKPGKKNWIGKDIYFVYGYDKKPKMGLVILKIQMFTREGEKLNSFLIQGESLMPAMAGAHDSGFQDFKLSDKKDYLLPLDVVMPGEWEVKLIFMQDDQPVFYGFLRFHV